jgi:hypothetical protein
MKRKWYLIIALIILGVIQFVRIDKSLPELNSENDFLKISSAPDHITQMIKESCYDCHSYESKYPWYAEIAPVSWYINHHINEGREHVNFSEWNIYSINRASRKLEACAEAIELKDMPLGSYTLLHSKASLNDDEIKTLSMWFTKQAKTEE